MSGRFIDTNILLNYVDPASAHYARAGEVLRSATCASVQVLSEFASVARNKQKLPWPKFEAAADLVCSLLDIRPLTLATHRLGIQLAQRYKVHVYDAMILAAALEAGCETLWTEDMQHGLLVEDRLRILNPFAAA